MLSNNAKKSWRFAGRNRAFTLAEVMIVIGIFGIIATFAVVSFSDLNKREALEKDVASLTAMLREARMLAVASKNSSQFGVHLESDKATLFEGGSYVAGGANQKIMEFSKQVTLSEYALSGGGQDVIFLRLTGNTATGGTLTLSLRDDSASTTITVLSTGVIQ